MRKSRRKRWMFLLAILVIVVAMALVGAGPVLALLVLVTVGGVMLFATRLYPADRAREDEADWEDRF